LARHGLERNCVLRSVKSLYGYRVGATDGLAGGVIDFYFNDQNWSVGQIVVSHHPTRWSKGVLLPTSAVRQADKRENVLHVNLTRAECDKLPPATSLLPVCRQYEMRNAIRPSKGDPHLRCTTAVAGYEIHDPEQHLGIVHDFLIDTETWTVAFLVGRRFGCREREFLVATSGVKQISFAGRRVAIEKSAHWDLVFAERNGYDNLLSPQSA
jgi:hypothetical protein